MNNRKHADYQAILPLTWSDLTIVFARPDDCDDIFELADDTRIFVRISDLREDARGKRADMKRVIHEASTVLLSACPSVDDTELPGLVVLPQGLLERCETVLDDAFERGGLVCMIFAPFDRVAFWHTTVRAFAKRDVTFRVIDAAGVTDVREAA